MSRNADNEVLRGWAMHYIRRGWKIIPIHVIINGACSCRRGPEVCQLGKDAGKHPVIGRWTDPSQMLKNEADVLRWWPDDPNAIPYSMGLVCGEASGVWLLDMDPRNGGAESLEELEAEIGVLPATLTGETGGGGRHFYFKVPAGTRVKKGPLHKDLPGLDVQGDGAQSLLPPSTHWSGKRYSWLTPLDTEIAEAPEALLKLIQGDRGTGGGAGGSFNLDSALRTRITEGGRNNALMKFATSQARRNGVTDQESISFTVAAVETYNQTMLVPPLDLDEVRKTIESALTFVRDNPNIDALPPEVQEWAANRAMERTPPAVAAPAPMPTPAEVAAEVEEGASGDPDEPLPPSDGEDGGDDGGDQGPPDGDNVDGDPNSRSLTDLGNSRRLIDVYGHDVRYTTGVGWVYWGETQWRVDEEKRVITELAKQVPRRVVEESLAPANAQRITEFNRHATNSRSAPRVNAMVGMGQSDPRINVPIDLWDSDSMLLGVRNGVVDLRTGELRPPSRDQYITQRCNVIYTPGVRDSRWDRFLASVTGGDAELIMWLQKAFGYTLTADVREEKFFLVYGRPGAGKSTLVETIGDLLGDYRMAVDAEDVTAGGKNGDQISEYEYARMRGKRMLIIAELSEAKKMKEGAIKKLTGADTIRGRIIHKEPIEFQATAKLWVDTNHRPIVRDDGMWRRMRAIPLDNPPPVPDPSLKPYLRDPEGGLRAALAWAVEGAVSWASDGLGTCKAVQDATAEYKKDEDKVGQFLADVVQESEGASVKAKQLYGMYRMWVDERGENPMTIQPFLNRLALEPAVKVEGRGMGATVVGIVVPLQAAPAPGTSGLAALAQKASWT